MRRVAITGLGALAPLGNDPAAIFTALRAGRSGVRLLEPALAALGAAQVGAVVDFDGAAHFEGPRLRMLDRVSQLALVAARQAIADARLSPERRDRSRVGVFIGTGMGGAGTSDEGYATLYRDRSTRIKPYSVLMAMPNAAASWIGIDYGITGPNLTYSTACSSSAVAIGEAMRRIRAGEVDAMIAGGAEAPFAPGVVLAWEALRTLATPDRRDPSASCRPFSRSRSGLVLGEGAAVFVLEAWEHAVAREARIYAEVAGYGLVTDAGHITRPSVDGQAAAMRAALADARMVATQIGYINAHGTGTLQNDAVETAAVKAVFGEQAYRVPVSSTKSMHGHLLGAAGALEALVTVLAIQTGVIPPTMHLNVPDPECDLDYVPSEARRHGAIEAALTNSFAFGGTNAVLALRASAPTPG